MKILVSRSGGLGDCILTLPFVAELKKRFPDAAIDLLGNPVMNEIAELTGLFEKKYSLDNIIFPSLFNDSPPNDVLRGFFSKYSSVYFFSCHNHIKLKSKITSFGVKECSVLDPRIPVEWGKHYSEYLFGIFGNNGGKIEPCLPDINLSWANEKRKGIIIHPGSGGKKKIWPIGKFIEIAENLGHPVKFILGPAEIEAGMGKNISGNFQTECPGNIGNLCQAIVASSFYIGCDSGVSHCSSLVKTKSLVIFGPTNHRAWKPLGENVRIIESENGDIENLTVSDVLDAIPSEFLLKK